MYIHPFICGVATTIFVEIALIIIGVCISDKKK